MTRSRALLLLLLLLTLAFSGTPAQAGDATWLVAIPIPNPAALAQFEQTGLPAYARLNTPAGELFIAAAPAGFTTRLPVQWLEPIPGDAVYYLTYPIPGRDQPNLSADARLLYKDSQQQLWRTNPAGARHLATRTDLWRQAMPLTPIPTRPRPAPPIPTIIDPDPTIQAMIDQVTSSTVYQYDGNLSGEWPVTIGGQPYTIATRHTYSGQPINKATQFVGEHLANLGLDVEYHNWSDPNYPNVIGEITGQTNPDQVYILSAHLDDMPSGSLAPGADDNASGVVAALIAADIFTQYEWGCTLRFGLWTGEEQGLLGSHAYAQRAYNNGEAIAGVLNLDMIAWNTPNSSRNIDLHARATMPATLQLAQLFADVINAYNLDLVPEIVPNGSGASDHASFWNYGYTAIMGIEDFGDFNPNYHTTQDLLANVDLDYFTDFVRASVGTFAHMSGCLITGDTGTLTGTVLDDDSGLPLNGATVTMTDAGGSSVAAMTNPAGQYTQTLASGSYTVTASLDGYLPATATGVMVQPNTTTTQDFSLAPLYLVAGTVTGIDGGAPLLAQITLTPGDNTTWTDPGDGSYALMLPGGTYTMTVTAAGYHPAGRVITVDQPQTQDFSLWPEQWHIALPIIKQ